MLWSVLVAALALASFLTAPPAPAGAAGAAPCGRINAMPTTLSLIEMRKSELCLINRIRVHFGLHTLELNADLRESATRHSDSMVRHHYFAHEGPGGSVDSRVSRAGYLYRARTFTIGENIAAGSGRLGSPWSIFDGWMHSSPHRANILDPGYRDAGVGVARGNPIRVAAGAVTYTVDFGARSGG